MNEPTKKPGMTRDPENLLEDPEFDTIDWDNLPPLSQKDLAALEALGPDFLKNLLIEAMQAESRRCEDGGSESRSDAPPSDAAGL